ncbi:MAG: sugar ABC transporter permease [Oscillospiraceae bacterium]
MSNKNNKPTADAEELAQAASAEEKALTPAEEIPAEEVQAEVSAEETAVPAEEELPAEEAQTAVSSEEPAASAEEEIPTEEAQTEEPAEDAISEEIAEESPAQVQEESKSKVLISSGDAAVGFTQAPRDAKAPKPTRISYERRKQLYGYGFIALWAIGTIYFFIMPLITSIRWSFYDTKPVEGSMELTNFGIHNFRDALFQDQNFSEDLVGVLGMTALKTPLIVIFSIFIAVILNQRFKGRTFARSIFFLPVIIATGPVINIINGNMDTGGYSGGSEQFNSMFETDLVGKLLAFIGIYDISDALTTVITTVTTDIFNLVWNAGIQILLFLSALQTIPPSAKEAANIEGATGWEYFWKVTIPYISPMVIAAFVYTVVDSFVDPANEVMTNVLAQRSSWQFGKMSAMAWIYFLIVGIVLAIVVAIINKFVYYEVE